MRTKKRKARPRLGALLLSLCMVLSLVSVTAFAEDGISDGVELNPDTQIEVVADGTYAAAENETDTAKDEADETGVATEEPADEPEADDENVAPPFDTTETQVGQEEETEQEEDAADETGEIAIDETNFPDENFRESVKRYAGNSNELSAEQLAKITEIDVDDKGISSLKGIEHFAELTKLSCSQNQLTELDVSKNTELRFLFCDRNELTSLDLSGNTELTTVFCGQTI